MARGLALGPSTLESLDKSVGDTVTLTAPSGQAQYSIVGTVLFPEGDFSHDQGIAFTVEGAERISGAIRKSAVVHQILFDWASGVDGANADDELAGLRFRVYKSDQGLVPAAVTNLDQVRGLPIALAAFLGLLALGTLTQAIATSTKMQHREFATMRALGAKSRTISALVVIHALVIAIVALAIGTPAGTVIGARVWMPIANSANVVVDTIAPWWWIGTMIGMAVLATLVLVAPSALGAKWRSPAQYL